MHWDLPTTVVVRPTRAWEVPSEAGSAAQRRVQWRGRELPTCAPHGLHYDDRRATGCVLCRRSNTPKSRPVASLIVAAGLLAVIAIANRPARGEATRMAGQARSALRITGR